MLGQVDASMAQTIRTLVCHTADLCVTLRTCVSHCRLVCHTAGLCVTLRACVSHCGLVCHTADLCATLRTCVSHCRRVCHTAAPLWVHAREGCADGRRPPPVDIDSVMVWPSWLEPFRANSAMVVTMRASRNAYIAGQSFLHGFVVGRVAHAC